MTDSLAGVIKLFDEKFSRPYVHVVCTLIGSGRKDPDTVFRGTRESIKFDAEVTVVEKVLEGIL